MVWARLGLLLPVLHLLLGADVARAARAPSADVIGADLLIRTADSCDLGAAFHLLNSSSFSPSWLIQAGSRGETPIMAAARAGCGQVLALVVLHPNFDHGVIKRVRQRRELARYALRHASAPMKRVQWAMVVVEGLRTGRVAQDQLEWSAKNDLRDFLWFLPKEGEWMPPMTLEQMGLEMPMRPEIPKMAMQRNTSGVIVTHGAIARVEHVLPLWYLMVAYVQSSEGSERRASVVRHVRSIGWSLFFLLGREALAGTSRVIDLLAKEPIDVPGWEDERHEHIRAEGKDVLDAYRSMGIDCGLLWNKTGDWVV